MSSKVIREFVQKDGKRLQLTESSVTHISKGNFSVRTLQGQDNMLVLSGGLHSYDAWVAFKKKHDKDLEHLHFFNSHEHKYWYFARELGNGVIALRLPRVLFTGKAAKITMYPDDYYKSGFLWKTLFPKGYGEEEIINAIEEALLNEDIEQRKSGQIVGYIKKDKPLQKIKVVIQYRQKQIMSAFPAWTQPNTGNNGKPFSHYDNIGFVISQSTEYFDDCVKRGAIREFNFTGTPVRAEEIHRFTPDVFKTRGAPSESKSVKNMAEKRREELKGVVLTEEEESLVFRYLNDFSLVKYYPELVAGVYEVAVPELLESLSFYNAFQIVQNFIDGMHYFYLTDQLENLTQSIVFLLENMVTHTILDVLSKKRITSAMMSIVASANSPELSYKFLVALSRSPIRRELYLEYNLDSLNKKRLNAKLPLEDFPDELVLVLNPELDFKLGRDDFVEILKEVLGETYTLNFEGDDLESIIDDILNDQFPNFDVLLKDSLAHCAPEDFLSLSEYVDFFLESASKYSEADDEELITSVGLILRDYCRIQFAHRQRINARYCQYHHFSGEMYLPINHDLLFGIVLKHERWINYMRLENLATKIFKFASKISSQDLQNDAKNFLNKIGKERPPLPEMY